MPHAVDSPSAGALRATTWRLLDTDFADAAANMAIDEAIQRTHAAGKVPPTLRFYGWDPPAVSIGYFQSMRGEVDLDACRGMGFGYVRRPTGGRAIFHHMELTYSVAIRAELLSGSVLQTCGTLSAGLLYGLRRLGAEPEVSAGEPDPRTPAMAPGASSAACFDSPGAYEMVVGGRKVVGSAQTRSAGTILQHGSLMLDIDVSLLFSLLRIPPHLKDRLAASFSRKAVGLKEALGREVGWEEARDAMAAGFSEALGLELVPGALTAEEKTLATQLYQEKYHSDAWNLKK